MDTLTQAKITLAEAGIAEAKEKHAAAENRRKAAIKHALERRAHWDATNAALVEARKSADERLDARVSKLQAQLDKLKGGTSRGQGN